ncbi:MAG: hypothetical protein JRG75_00475 [Deltaproteobacteria bacterium]|nr:hypothetical protein [Deltaproteobacteria bacterium]
MIDHFETIIYHLFEPDERGNLLPGFDPDGQFDENIDHHAETVKALNTAFLVTLAGSRHSSSNRAEGFLEHMAESSRWKDLAKFYLSAKGLIHKEIETVCTRYPDF